MHWERQSTIRNRRWASLAAAFAAGLLHANPAPASTVAQSDPSADALFVRVLERSAKVTDFRAHFEQSLIPHGLAAPPVESGEVYYQRPASLRWEYAKPERKLAVSDGHTGWLHLPAERRALRMNLDDGLAGGPVAALLSGGDASRKRFSTERIDSPPGQLRLRLVPREPAGSTAAGRDAISASIFPFDAIELTVDEKTLRIVSVEVIDPGGNRMLYRFFAMKENIGLAPALFVFSPPPGVSVVPQ